MSSPYLTSKKLIPITIFIDVSREGEPFVLSDAEAAKLDKDKLPHHIKKETSQWRRPSWSLSTLITVNSYVEDEQGRQRFDITRFAKARMRCLLVDWSLKDGDPALALEATEPPEAPGIKLLTDSALKVMGGVDTAVVEGFYSRAMMKIFPDMNVLGAAAGILDEGN